MLVLEIDRKFFLPCERLEIKVSSEEEAFKIFLLENPEDYCSVVLKKVSEKEEVLYYLGYAPDGTPKVVSPTNVVLATLSLHYGKVRVTYLF